MKDRLKLTPAAMTFCLGLIVVGDTAMATIALMVVAPLLAGLGLFGPRLWSSD